MRGNPAILVAAPDEIAAIVEVFLRRHVRKAVYAG
jgi:hypothetical protein